MSATEVIRLIVLGTGQRGHAYAQFCQADPLNPFQIVAIAEPQITRARAFAERYNVPAEAIYQDYRKMILDREKLQLQADAVLICLQDSMHLDCLLQFAGHFHILCEKPMAQTLEDCIAMRDLLQTGSAKNKLFGMGHVLRYSPHNIALKEMLTTNVIGDLVSIQHTEPVGHAHFAHSYVRGNWRKQDISSFSLLTKCCHDLDIIQWFLGPAIAQKPITISSTGALTHFHRRRKPKEARSAIKCLECSYESECPYSAKKIYIDSFQCTGTLNGFQRALTDLEDLEGITTALKDTNYGTCVYEMDNDVCDNQMVQLQYQSDYGPITVSFHMIAFSRDQCIRKTTLYGSRGQIDANGIDLITISDFASGTKHDRVIEDKYGAKDRSHAGGDFGLISEFVKAIRELKSGKINCKEAQQAYIGCTVEDIFRSHEVVFASEQSRLLQQVIRV